MQHHYLRLLTSNLCLKLHYELFWQTSNLHLALGYQLWLLTYFQPVLDAMLSTCAFAFFLVFDACYAFKLCLLPFFNLVFDVLRWKKWTGRTEVRWVNTSWKELKEKREMKRELMRVKKMCTQMKVVEKSWQARWTSWEVVQTIGTRDHFWKEHESLPQLP